MLCLGLVPDDEKQKHLFAPVGRERGERGQRLMVAVDKLNFFYGRGTVRTAAAGFDQRWAGRQARKSPCYTTRLADLPRALL